MRNLRSFACLAATSLCALSPSLYGDTIERGSDNDVDVQALREWINIKRQVTVKEIGGNLSISGEVRTKFKATGETVDGISIRGNPNILNEKSKAPFPSRGFDVNARLMMDYRSDATWASIKLEFNDRAGIFSGSVDKIKLSRAYFGARAFQGDSYYVDFELGRKKLNSTFDSELQFDSLFDGVLAKYDQSFEQVGDFYVHLGTFIINDTIDQFGYVGETGLMNIAGSGFYTKFSVIDWDTKDMHNDLAQKRFDFIVSQMTVGYKFYPAVLKKEVTIYAAGLYNFKAKRLPITDNQKANWGSYVGFSIGELKRKGDWAIDANYQWLAAQCVPNFDVGGIGFANSLDTGFYTENDNGTGKANTRGTAGGNVNYRGVTATLNYLITNNINLQQQWSQSITLDHDIGPSKRFKQYEIEFIYNF